MQEYHHTKQRLLDIKKQSLVLNTSHASLVLDSNAPADAAAALSITTITFNPDDDLKDHLHLYDYNANHWSDISALSIFRN